MSPRTKKQACSDLHPASTFPPSPTASHLPPVASASFGLPKLVLSSSANLVSGEAPLPKLLLCSNISVLKVVLPPFIQQLYHP